MANEPEIQVLGRGSKLVLTAGLYCCFIAYGIGFSMIGPARLDIVELVGTDFVSISYGAVTRAVGYMVGALTVSVLFTRMSRQLGLVTALIGSGTAMLAVPFVRVLWLYLTAEMVTGLMAAAVDVACNSWILEIWQESANPYMQGMHFSYALGQTVAPLITEPFLSPDSKQQDNGTNILFDELGNNGTSHSETRIVVPYSISAVTYACAGIVIVFLYFRVPYVDPKRTVSGDSTTVMNNNSVNNNVKRRTQVPDLLASSGCSSDEQLPPEDEPTDYLLLSAYETEAKRYHWKLVAMGCVLLCCYTGLELSTFNFIPEFAVVIDLRLSKSKAAFLTSVMSGAFAANRFFSIIVASKIKPKKMLYMSFLMLLTGNSILLFFANTSEPMLWVGVILMGSGHSSVFPCIMSFLEQRVNVTTTVCGFFMLASAVSSGILPIVVGNYVESFPLIYVYVNLFLLTACFTVFSCLWTVDRRFRRRRRALNLL